MGRLFERLLEKRGFSVDFLHPKYEKLTNPFLLSGMQEGVARIKKAILKNEHILIYGDYDADGVTASVVLHDALEMAGANRVDVMLPNRFKDGYGMNMRVADYAVEQKIDLVITVDCGSNNADVVAKLMSLGVDVVVSDHHEIMGELPKAVAVINPKRDKILHELAGVGVAFKIVQALVLEGLIKSGKEKWFLDLVAIGTVCDSMELVGENRILCYYGMVVLNKTSRVGLRELKRRAGVAIINSDALGYQIGPRINVAGRLESPDIALKLLMSKSATEAMKIAEILEGLNIQRKQLQNQALADIYPIVDTEDRVIVVNGEWHEGILGIVAGKLVEKYKKPAFVLTKIGDELKGSGRSFGDFNLAKALQECQNSIVAGGGHSGACGLKVLMAKIDDFKKAVNEYYDDLKLVDQEKYLDCIEDLTVDDFSELDLDFWEEIKGLEPFGSGNEVPVFLLANATIYENVRLGSDGQHLRLCARDQFGHFFKSVAFYAPDEWFNFGVGTVVNIWIQINENKWNGTRSVEGRILKVMLAE